MPRQILRQLQGLSLVSLLEQFMHLVIQGFIPNLRSWVLQLTAELLSKR